MVLKTSPTGINAIKSYAKLGKKYTIAFFDEDGYVHQRCFVLENISYKPYKDTINPCLLIIKGNSISLKWLKFIRLWEGYQFILWEGYHNVNTSRIVSSGPMDTPCGHVIVEKGWPVGDVRYLHRARRSIKQLPVAEYVPDITDPERLITYQCIS